MGSVKKATAAAAEGWIFHNTRAADKDSNDDIDRSRSPNNYSLTPGLSIPKEEHYARRKEIALYEVERYRNLKEQFYCLPRKDVKTLVSVVVTCPREITDPKTEDRFFEGVAAFLTERYGNCVGIEVHKDEGKYFQMPDGSKEFHEGRAHLHYTFIPTVTIDHAKLAKKKNPVKAMFAYKEKISAKERITRSELIALHPDLNKFMNEKWGIKCNLNSGITQELGGNRTVDQLKKEFDANIIKELSIENDRLTKELQTARTENMELIKENTSLKEELSKQQEQSRNHTVNQGWGNRNWSKTIEEDKLW